MLAPRNHQDIFNIKVVPIGKAPCAIIKKLSRHFYKCRLNKYFD